MILYNKNQNDIIEAYELDMVFENKPINRLTTKLKVEDKYSQLNILREKIQNLKNCELKDNAKNFVFNDGDPNSEIMIIGEGPGKMEDELGKPFVGDAGKLLDKMFKAINISRDKIYITNVVNYRPPNNRKPEASEIIKYSFFLKKHIEIINPKIVILLGSTAMEALLGSNMKITKERGNWLEIKINNKSFKTMITFHPAYLLRQPNQKKYSWEDLKKIRKEIDISNIKI